MHRHGYQGKKFGRETDQRRALMKSLAEALILKESIETTLPKAKEVKGYVEKLITKAKKDDLHNRRQVISGLQTLTAAFKLIDGIAPQLSGRNSGYLRVKRTNLRRGDGAQLATISFVDELKVVDIPEAKEKPVAKPAKKTPVRKTAAKRPTKKEVKV
jgi:large subunit ribosomal protein L17